MNGPMENSTRLSFLMFIVLGDFRFLSKLPSYGSTNRGTDLIIV